MKRRLLLGAGVVVAVVAVVVAFVVWPRGTSPVTLDEAVDDFRSRTTLAPAPATDESPEPGVYRYDTTGSEDVRLGVLPTEHREYPELVTAVVVTADPGCFTMTLNLLDQHTEDTTYCTGDDGSLRLAAHTKHQQIGSLSPEATMACDPAVIVDPARDTSDLRCTLTIDGGPAQLTATLTGTSTTAPDTVTVAGAELDATRVTIAHEISGGLSGSWSESLWLAADTRLPLRIERELHIEGLATFTESSELHLADTAPTR